MVEPNPAKPPSKVRVAAIIRRYVCKPDVTPNWRTDVPAFYELWHQYPSLPFWENHELSWPLNSMLWFKTEQGQAQLASDFLVFNWPGPSTPERAPDAVESSAVDTTPIPVYHPPTPSRPNTVASFLSSSS